jgi:large subunit ribosomal protein L9
LQVILKSDVEKIGQRGDIVDVSRGYVRNFLVPRGLAEVATPSKLEEARRTMEESEERDRRLAERARGIRLDRRRIRLEEPIKALGTHQVPIQIHGETEASVKVIVVPKL